MSKKSKAKKSKSAAREADVSRQREEVRSTMEQFLGQLVPGSEEYNQLLSEGQRLMQTVSSPANEQSQVRQLGQRLVSQQQQRTAGAIGPLIRTASGEVQQLGPSETLPAGATVISPSGATTPLEARTQAHVGQLRAAVQPTTVEQDLLSVLEGRTPTTAFGRSLEPFVQPTGSPIQQDLTAALEGRTTSTPSGDIFRDIVSRARTPETFESQFPQDLAQQLQIVNDRINQQYANRGLLGSGLQAEAMGRAGVELAVNQARAREQARLDAQSVTLQQRQQGIQNVGALLDRLEAARQARLQDVEGIYGLGENLRQRQIGLEEALTNLQSGRESRLTDLLSSQAQAGLGRQSGLLERQTGRAQDLQDIATSRELATNAALGRLLGQGASTAAFFIPTIGPALSAVGSAATQAAFPNPGSIPHSSISQSPVQDLLAAQRTLQGLGASPQDLRDRLDLQPPGNRKRFPYSLN